MLIFATILLFVLSIVVCSWIIYGILTISKPSKNVDYKLIYINGKYYPKYLNYFGKWLFLEDKYCHAFNKGYTIEEEAHQAGALFIKLLKIENTEIKSKKTQLKNNISGF